jgi:hypothetical protein
MEAFTLCLLFRAHTSGDIVLVPIEFIPHVNYLRRNLFGNIPLKTVAYRQEALIQKETISVSPIISLP